VNVLAIDGGGVRGIIPAVILAYWEGEAGISLPDHFGLFAGTSTGAILAGCLAAGLPAREVLDLFQKEAPGIFNRDGLPLLKRTLSFKGWAIPAFSSEHLKKVLDRHLGDLTLGQCPRPLVIAALDVVTGNPKLFRSAHLPESGSDRDVKVSDAILASTAAPVFFPSMRVGHSTYVDGALWANNPSLAAMLEAKSHSSADVNLLSVSCGRPLWGERLGFGANRGLVGWGVPLIALLMAAQSDGVDAYMRQLLPAEKYLRLDPILPRHLASIDSAGNLSELASRAHQAAVEALPALRQRF
jgi:predicted acylesterase/phospholipase RssA